jgi:hypothetical protein
MTGHGTAAGMTGHGTAAGTVEGSRAWPGSAV